MADPLSLLFTPRPNRRVSIGAILLDATISEEHEATNVVTNHPIEDGGFVTDHVYEEPDRVTIEGEITNTPVMLFGGLVGITDRRIEAFEQLRDIRASRDIVTLVTGLKVYTNMVMTSLSTPRTQTTGGRLQFTASFQDVRKVASQVVGVVDVAKAAPEQQDQVQSETDIGRQEAAAGNTAQTTRSSSVLNTIIGGFESTLEAGAQPLGN